ncbi:MAG: hypothetical protein ACRBB3_07350 [Alphaproteobacteria bacterium]
MARPNLPEAFDKNKSPNYFKGAKSFGEYLHSTGLYENENDLADNFDSLIDETREWLGNKGYKQAEILMDLMLDCNVGKTRQDGKTPSALHEMTQAIWLISCIEDDLHVDDPQNVLSVIFSHDLGEDFNIKPNELEQHLVDNGIQRSEKTEALKKSFDAISKRYGKNGEERHENEYDYSCAVRSDRDASIAKMFDRAHNIMTLIGVKDKSKMADYTAKTLQLQHDNVKEASNNFPSQEPMYKTLQQLIRQEIQTCYYYMVDTGKKITDNDNLESHMPDQGFKNMPLGIHPLIVSAERVRHTYPNTHLEDNNKMSPEEKKHSINDNHDLSQ